MPRPTHLRSASQPEVLPPDSPYAYMGLCLRLAVWGLFLLLGIHPASAQFNGLNGIFALNSMTFVVMPTFTIVTPGTGYASGDISTLDCPNTTIFTNPGGTMPTFTYNGTTWTLTTPGIGTFIPSSGTPTQKNGICTLTQSSTTGSGTGLSLLATFGFRSAGGAASGVNNDISALLGGQILLGPQTPNGASPFGATAILTGAGTGPFGLTGGVSMYGSPYGWGATAGVLCIAAYLSSSTACPITGGLANHANGWATYTSRDVVTFLPQIYGPTAPFQEGSSVVDSVNLMSMPGTFTANSFIPTTPINSAGLANLAFRQVASAYDAGSNTTCTGMIYNWQIASATTLYTQGWVCSGTTYTTPVSTSVVTVMTDPAALPGTWASATKFTLTTPFNPTQTARLRGGMPVDTRDGCAGALTDWDTNAGAWINVSAGFFRLGSGTACTPTGSTIIIQDQYKVFGINEVQTLYPYSRAYSFANEFDCNNNQSPLLYNGSNLAIPFDYMDEHYQKWCLDVINMGTYGDMYGLVFRGNPSSGDRAFFNAIRVMASTVNAFSVSPENPGTTGIAFETRGLNGQIGDIFRDWHNNGNIFLKMPSFTGTILLGDEGNTTVVTTTPGIYLFPSGAAAGSTSNWDAAVYASGGSGAQGTAKLTIAGLANFTTLNGTQFAIADGGSSTVNYWVCHGGSTGLPAACFPNSNGDSNQSVSIGARGSGSVYLGSTTDAGLGNSALQVGANGSTNNNRVTIFGASSGSPPIIGPNGGVDTNISLRLTTKGTGSIDIVPGVDSANAFNVKNAAGSANILTIDSANSLVIIPSTSTLQFGTYATSCTVGGYISIKDAGGTSRKLAVCN